MHPGYLAADGMGAANVTAAFQGAATRGGTWYVPAGTYILDEVTCSTEVHWILDPGAVLKMRSAVNDVNNIFDFAAGSEGSSITGGTFDGNRDSLKAAWAAFANQDAHHTGIRVLNVDRVTLHDIRFQNFISWGVWLQGDWIEATHLRFDDCGKMSHVKFCSGSNFSDWIGRNIGVDADYETYQHANEWRLLNGCSFSNINIYNFTPQITTSEPRPEAIAFEQCDDTTVSNVNIVGYSGVSSSDEAVGFYADTLRRCSLTGICVSGGYTNGIYLSTCDDVSVVGGALDGGYVDDVAIGILVTHAGISTQGPGGAVSGNGRAVKGSHRAHIADMSVTGFLTGVSIRGSSYVTFADMDVVGNIANGYDIDRNPAHSFFPGRVDQVPRSVEISGGRARYNGQCGVVGVRYGSLRVHNVDLRDNGQDSAQASTLRSGFRHGGVAAVGSSFITHCLLGDSQTFTFTDGASFIPGSTDADNRYQISLIDPQTVSVGQWVTLVNADGAGDIAAKVVEVVADLATVETAGAETFSETGNLTSLTGTLSTSGVTVTGTGTAFDTEIAGPTVIKVSGQYRTVIRVNSATSAVLDSAFSGTISGASAEKITVDVSGIPSQQYGIRAPSGSNGKLFCKDNNYDGVVTAPFSQGDDTQFADGSEVIYATAVAGVSVNTGGASTNLISSLPTGWWPYAARAVVKTTVAGVDSTTFSLEWRDASGLHASIANFSALTAGGVAKGLTTTYAPFDTTGNVLACRLSGGADNTPSAGAVRAEALLIVPGFVSDLA